MHKLFVHCLLEKISILLAKINKHLVKTDAYISLVECGVMGFNKSDLLWVYPNLVL